MSPNLVHISRRDACAIAGTAAAAFAMGALPGCSGGAGAGSGEQVSQGFASDTQVKSEALTVYIVADDRLKRAFAGAEDGLGRLESYFSRYQAQARREQVTFAVKYYPLGTLNQMATEGFSEGTAVVALTETVEAACDAGTLYGGAGNVSVRAFTTQLFETLVVLRAAGGSAEMPQADTLNGEDSEDGSISRMQNLHTFEGKIGVVDESLMEGMLANRVLARWGYYSEEDGAGGEYSKSIKSKMVVYKTVDKLVDALAGGKCQLAFGLQSMLWGDYPQVEEVYQPSAGGLVYSGASITDAENDAVARDFFEFITRCS